MPGIFGIVTVAGIVVQILGPWSENTITKCEEEIKVIVDANGPALEFDKIEIWCDRVVQPEIGTVKIHGFK